MGFPWYVCVGAATAVLLMSIAVLFWREVHRYPMCSACGSNAHVIRESGAPKCTLHGPIIRSASDDRQRRFG